MNYSTSCAHHVLATAREEEREERNAFDVRYVGISCHIRQSLTDTNTYLSRRL